MGVIPVEEQIVFKKINEIRPYARNPRRNEKTVELLCKLIPKVGFNVPLVIDERGIIVKGHARFAAAIRLGMTELPCIITHASEEAIKADRITDNKIAEFSEWMNDEVLQEIDEINTDIDFSELGFPKVEFDGMPEHEMPVEASESPAEAFLGRKPDIPMDKAEKPVKMAQKRYYKCVCPDCGHVMFVKEDLLKG